MPDALLFIVPATIGVVLYTVVLLWLTFSYHDHPQLRDP